MITSKTTNEATIPIMSERENAGLTKKASMRVFDALLVLIFLAMLLSPACCAILRHIATDLPDFITNERNVKLAGGMDASDIRSCATIEKALDGSFQAALGKGIGNYVPAKASMLLLDAAVQRSAIELSNGLFDWDCYPTHYGSGYGYIRDYEALRYIPSDMDSILEEETKTLFRELNAVADAHPDIDFVVYVVDALGISQTNPMYELTSSDKATLDDFVQAAKEMGFSDNIELMHDEYSSQTEYYENFFKTDHHWNMDGTYVAYSRIIDALDIPDKAQLSGKNDLGGIEVFGPVARAGRCYVTEHVSDYSNLVDGLEVLSADGLRELISMNSSWMFWNPDTIIDFYTQRYTLSLGQEAIICGPGEGTTLIISDSFGESLRYLLAYSSEQTINRDDLSNGDDSIGIDDLIDEYRPDRIILVGGAENLASLPNRLPNYLVID